MQGGGGAAAGHEAAKRLKGADPTVNLAADDADGWSGGFGLLHAANKVNPKGSRSLPCLFPPASASSRASGVFCCARAGGREA